MATTTQTDLLDKRILNLLQSRFPLAERPYRRMAEELGTTEDDMLRRIGRLKKANVVRQISAIFDTRRLGYKTCLVAFRYPPGRLEKGARFVNRHPGVSHNYARNGHFNLWFTIAVPPHEDLQRVVDWMAERTGAEAARVMPTIRFFKIGVNFDMVKNEGAAYEYYSPDGYGAKGSAVHKRPEISENWNRAEKVSERDIQVIRELQEDLPLEPRPFDAMAERLGMTPAQLFAYAQDLQDRQLMRRFSAVLYHRKAGFRSNAMAVWQVPEERADEVGLKMAESPWVTHCYQRPTFPDWKYTHFTMIHATSQDQCEKVARDISEATGITEYQLLYSTREYKKTRVRYFVEDELISLPPEGLSPPSFRRKPESSGVGAKPPAQSLPADGEGQDGGSLPRHSGESRNPVGSGAEPPAQSLPPDGEGQDGGSLPRHSGKSRNPVGSGAEPPAQSLAPEGEG